MTSIARRLFDALRPAPAVQVSPQQSLDREEKGYNPTDSEHLSRSIQGRPNTMMPVDPSDRLLVFRTLTGIDTVPVLKGPGFGGTPRSAANIGIYTRVIREERRSKKAYRVLSAGIHICLGLQIVIGAAITAVAASNGSHRAITGLGAINTIFAGALAYVKGSGYPEGLKQHEFEWKKIREYVEQRERELCLAGSGLDVYHEVRVIESMYHHTKRELKLGRMSKEPKLERYPEQGNAEQHVDRRRSDDIRPLDSTNRTTTSTMGSTTQRPDHLADSSMSIHPIHDKIHEH
jgi:hypothetical protein